MAERSTPTPEAFKALVGNRKIYVFSVNVDGIGFMRRFTRLGLDVGGFIDSREFKDRMQRGKPVIHPDQFFAGDARDVFVLVAAKHRPTRKWAIDLCERFGLERHRTYVTSIDLCDFQPTIEVSGICNLRCISCNMGLPGANRRGGLMSAETYRRVLAKMSDEIPFLNSVYLYQWGEPLLNSDLPEIVRITAEFGLTSEVSTNLIDVRQLDRLIEAGPDVLHVPCSGTDEHFELTRTGGKWDVFRANLFKLRDSLDRHRPETVVRITYHLYKHNLEADYDEVSSLARELGFQLMPVLAHIFPEQVLRHVVHGEPLPEQMQRVDELLCFSMREQLEYARQNKHRICTALKAFPTVRWDTSVVQCCNMMEPRVAPSFLATPLSELLARRDANGFCGTCMDYGMHRFFDVVASVATEDGRRVVART